MRRLFCAAALLAALPACAPKPEAPAAAPGKLHDAVGQAKDSRSCARIIPMEWLPSWPVPTGNKNGREFEVLFYPMTSDPDASAIGAPLGEATVDAADGFVSDCRRFPGSYRELAKERWPEAFGKKSIKEFERREGLLYSASEDIGTLYAAGGAPTPEQSQKARAYGRLFLEMAEPALAPYYYQMNPAFWQWLEKNGAATGVKP